MEYNFNVEQTVENLIKWTRDWFNQNGPNMNVVIGMSGGKDSTITAKLLTMALGADRVIGVALPQGEQSINDADKICEYLGIKYMCVNIGETCNALAKSIIFSEDTDYANLTNNSVLNIPPRVRMTTLYAIAQSNKAFVVNNCNLSEDYIGYATKFGDGAGDFSLLSDLTVTEILKIGDYLGLPHEWVHKTPDDGLPHSCPDEEKFGFSYAELDEYIRAAKVPEGTVKNSDELKYKKIDNMHKWNLHKLKLMPRFNPNLNVYVTV